MEIAGYLKTSLIEWPGKISSVIFTQGCNFRCPFCHNADLVEDKIERLSRINEEQIIADLNERKKWVDAVVVTGGEPTLQKDLPAFMKKLKDMGFLVMIHTNGTNPEVIAKLLDSHLVDYVCMDLKGNFDDYERYTNVQCKIYNVQKTAKLVINSGVEYEFRTTVVPGLHDLANLVKLAGQIAVEVQRCKGAKVQSKSSSEPVNLCTSVPDVRWFLQQFRPMNTYDKKYLKVKPFSKEEMEIFQKEVQKIVPQTYLRGI